MYNAAATLDERGQVCAGRGEGGVARGLRVYELRCGKNGEPEAIAWQAGKQKRAVL